jgi:hypothetical protein
MKDGVARRAAWGLLLLLVVASSMLAATCGKNAKGGVKKGSGIYISSTADLKPDADPGAQAANYGGTVFPVEVKTKKLNNDFTIDLWHDGVSFEQEKYLSTDTEFDLMNAAGEDYTPPIPLLYFPMNAGDSWNWSGQMMIGPSGRAATAVISTREDTIDMSGSSKALVVEVNLSMDSGANVPATRKLSFWFVKGKGIVERNFGASTSRAPATASGSGGAAN